MSDLRYVRVYVREAKQGDLPMGCREVFVLSEDSVYPTVFYLANMSVALLMAEDFESAVDREVTPQMAKSMLRIIDTHAPKNPAPDTEDALLRIAAYARHILSTADKAVRVRTRARVAETARVRVRARPSAQAEPETRVRKRVRSKA